MKLRRVKKEGKAAPVLRGLLGNGTITQQQYDMLSAPVKPEMTQSILLEKLVDLDIIQPYDALDESVKDFISELGSLTASDIVGFINDLREDKKGLTNMTPIPQKSFPIPGNVLFLGLIGAAMAIVIIAPNWESISKGLHIGTPAANGAGGLGGLFGSLIPHAGGHLILGIQALLSFINPG